jgi:FG-GAP-like repeat
MQNNQDCEAKKLPTTATVRSRQLLGAALLAAALLPGSSVPTADAGTEASKSPQALVNPIPSAPCRTAPARNTPRKRAAVATVFRNFNQLTNSVVLPSTGTSFGAPQVFAQNDGGFSPLDLWSAGDFDNDGDQDLIAAWNNGGTTGLALRRSVGNAFVTSHVPIPAVPWSADTIWVPGDFDNDGDSDLAAILHDGAGTSIDVYSSTGSGFAAPQRRMTGGIPWVSTTKWSVGDFDGDGKDDLVSVANNGGLAASVVWLSNATATAFLGSTWSNYGGWNDWSQYVAGDFTGDGRADLATIWENVGGNASIGVFPSTGTAFTNPTQWSISTYSFGRSGHVVAGHFNDDDKADLIMDFDNDGTGWRIAFLSNSTGTAFVESFNGYNGVGYWDVEDSVCAGVFNAQ